MPPFCFIASSSHVPRPKAKLTKKMFSISESSAQQFFSARRTSLWESAFFFFMTTWDKWRESFRAVHALLWLLDLLLACRPVSPFGTEAKDWEEEELVFIPISASHKCYAFSKCLRIFGFNQLFFFSPPARSCRKSFFGQDWLPVQEVHQPQICPAEIKPSWGAIFNAKVAVVEIYSILYKLYIYISMAMAGLNRFEVAQKKGLAS